MHYISPYFTGYLARLMWTRISFLILFPVFSVFSGPSSYLHGCQEFNYKHTNQQIATLCITHVYSFFTPNILSCKIHCSDEINFAIIIRAFVCWIAVLFKDSAALLRTNSLLSFWMFAPLDSCREVKRRIRGAEDGEFPIMFSPHCAPVKLYCYGMNTDDPLEYLTLPAGADNNYAAFHKERLKNFNKCDGPTDPSPTLTARYWGTTKWVSAFHGYGPMLKQYIKLDTVSYLVYLFIHLQFLINS